MPNTDDAEDTKKILIFVEVVDKPDVHVESGGRARHLESTIVLLHRAEKGFMIERPWMSAHFCGGCPVDKP
jgi:hypothetical protein